MIKSIHIRKNCSFYTFLNIHMKNFKKIWLLVLSLVVVWWFLTGCWSSAPDAWNTASANYEEITLWHNGSQLVPASTTLPAGKDYKFMITPEKNGAWCMSTIKRKWTTTADAKLVTAWNTVEFVINDAQPWTYDLVCNGMWMKQWSIVIQG